MLLRLHATITPRCHASSFDATMPLGCHAFTSSCYHVSTLPCLFHCFHAPRSLCFYLPMLPCPHVPMPLSFYATMLPGPYAFTSSCYHVSRLPCCHDAMLPCLIISSSLVTIPPSLHASPRDRALKEKKRGS